MQYSCCIEMLFTQLPLVQRIAAARQAGCDGVEFWQWQNKDLNAIGQALADEGMPLFSMLGNQAGCVFEPSQADLYIEGVMESMDQAARLNTSRLILTLGNESSIHQFTPRQLDVMNNTLRKLADQAKQYGITLMLEPLNSLIDHCGCPLNCSGLTYAILRRVGRPEVKMLYDIYHMQIMEGNILTTLQGILPTVEYLHIAGVPGRNEPYLGELNYPRILQTLQAKGFDGIVGLEFTPTQASSHDAIVQTLTWLKETSTI